MANGDFPEGLNLEGLSGPDLYLELQAAGLSPEDIEARFKAIAQSIKEIANSRVEGARALGLFTAALKDSAEAEAASAQAAKELTKAERVLTSVLSKKVNSITDIEQALDALQKQQVKTRSTQIQQDAFKKATKTGIEFAKSLTGIKDILESTDPLDQFAVGLVAVNKDTKEAVIGSKQLEKVLENLTNGFKKIFDPTNLAANAMGLLVTNLNNIGKQTEKVSDEIVKFNQETGSPGAFNDVINDAASRTFAFGISAADAGKNFETLFKTVRDFADLTPQAQIEVTETTSLLRKMGFGADASAQNILFLTKAMGASATDAANFNVNLMVLSQNLNMPIKELTKGFTAAQKVLAASAQTTEEVQVQFAQLAAQSKATNISVERLVAVAQKFDTFETAATQVGRLNAMLGGPFLSTVQMVTATNPAERIQLLAEALDQAGKSFNDMAYFERKAIADAAGLADVNELALLMSGNLSMLAPPEMTEEQIVAMKKQMQEFTNMTNAVKNLGVSLVVAFSPVFDFFKGIVVQVSRFFALVSERLTADPFGLGTSNENFREFFQSLMFGFTTLVDFISIFAIPIFDIVAGVVNGIAISFNTLTSAIKTAFEFIFGEGSLDAFASGLTYALEVARELSFIFQGIGMVLGFIIVPSLVNAVGQMTLLAARSALTAASLIKGAIGSAFSAVAAIYRASAAYGPLGIAAAIAGTSSLVGAFLQIPTLIKADDMMSPGGNYGNRVLLAPEGAFALNNRDTVVAGTDLTRNSVANTQNNTQVAQARTAAPAGPINLNVALSIDGTEFKTFVNSVKVDSTLNNNLYNSIAGMIDRSGVR